MSLYSQEKEQEVQIFFLYFEDCFSRRTDYKSCIAIVQFINSLFNIAVYTYPNNPQPIKSISLLYVALPSTLNRE